MTKVTVVHTIGHSNHTWESFAALLRLYGIQSLVDVRTNPVSRWVPFANRRRLPSLLRSTGIRYLYMGDTLGGRPADPSAYGGDGKPDYARVSKTPSFRTGVRQLLALARGSTIAIMCAEEDPGRCHRALLIGTALERHGAGVLHIRKHGTAGTQAGPTLAQGRGNPTNANGPAAGGARLEVIAGGYAMAGVTPRAEPSFSRRPQGLPGSPPAGQPAAPPGDGRD